MVYTIRGVKLENIRYKYDNNKYTQSLKQDNKDIYKIFKNKKIMLIGLGPHAKRIYMHYLMQYDCQPKVIVDLYSKKEDIDKFVKEKNINSVIYLIEDSQKNSEELSVEVKNNLEVLIKDFDIKYVIIATEPKAHLAYSKYFLEKRINILIDKPITATYKVSTDERQARKIYNDYKEMKDIYEDARKSEINFTVQCQRRWHPGYQYIFSLLKECIKEYKIPITFINIYHCDGMWNMPNEFFTRENHPYKYGYGKLMHSGYHFLDLLACLLKINLQLCNKKIDNFELYTSISKPSDQLNIINKEFYNDIFKSSKFNGIFENISDLNLDSFGEVDYSSSIQAYSGNDLITMCNLNLLQSGYSRRSWSELPYDTYKSNGRVRHEYVNIQVGPLMNIQIHSYQSKEIKKREKLHEEELGGLEHFDIYVFRNVDIIGGKPLEIKRIRDLNLECKNSFIGYNEEARKTALIEYLNNNMSNSDLADHDLSVKFLSNSYLSMAKRYNDKSPIVKFEL